MTVIPPLRQDEIVNHVGRRGFQRGRDYYLSDAISAPRRQGLVLKASCAGTSVMPYRVQVTFNHHGITNATCTCPVGSGGHCKHVAALLICWWESPEKFVEAEELDASLQRCSRGELVGLIKQLLYRQPSLESFLEEALPSSGIPREPTRPETYRQQIAALLLRAADVPDATSDGRLAEQIRAIKEIGDAFARQHEYGSAAVVYEAIVAELLEHPETFDQRRPALVGLVNECIEALGQCLADIREDAEAREGILKTLLGVYYFDLVYEGTSRDDVVELFINDTNSRERRTIARWIGELIPATDSRAGRRALGGLLLELEGDQLDNEAFCQICRRTDRTLDLVRRLVKIGRVEQAIEEARQADTYDLLRTADLLVRHRNAEAAEQLVESRCDATGEHALHQWLKKHRTFHRDQRAALKLSERIFRLQPNLDVYSRLRKLGRELSRWDELHPVLLAFLEESGYMQMLVRIHLDENDVDRALELVASNSAPMNGSGLELGVAQAAERSRPHEALEIYCTHVESLIARRNREQYVEASRFLLKVRALMKRTGGARTWTNYIAALRNQHHSLRALLEELTAARL